MKKQLNLALGLLVSFIFIYLAFRQTQISHVLKAIQQSFSIYFFLLLLFVLLSAYLRAVRWYYFMLPLQKIQIKHLFSSMMIGYGANVILPAHLGEIIRAYVLSKKEKISLPSTFATIVVERIIDIITFLFLLVFLFVVYDFPLWVKKSALIIFVLTIVGVIVLIFLSLKTRTSLNFINILLKPAPSSITRKLNNMIKAFVEGLNILGKTDHYFIIFILSIAIWLGYAAGFAAGIAAFKLNLPWITPLVLMVITTISIVVPSSPGYIGTYHYMCQLALGLFGIAKNEALAVAIIMHAFNTIPFLIIGIYYAWSEGLNLLQISKSAELESQKMKIKHMEKEDVQN